MCHVCHVTLTLTLTGRLCVSVTCVCVCVTAASSSSLSTLTVCLFFSDVLVQCTVRHLTLKCSPEVLPRPVVCRVRMLIAAGRRGLAWLGLAWRGAAWRGVRCDPGSLSGHLAD